MKVRFIQGIVAAAVLSAGSLVYGQTSNAIPYEQTFEAMTEGQSILLPDFSNGWYADTNSQMVAIATNVSYTWAGGMVLHPVTNAAHTKVLYFSNASMSNEFKICDPLSPTNTTMDFMVQAIGLQDVNSNSVADCQTALYLDTNGFVNVWYGLDNSSTNNAWMTFTNMPALGTSSWARVTVAFDYITDQVNFYQYFMVKVNGVALLPPNGLGYIKQSGYFDQGPSGNWLITANQNAKQVRAFALSGSGMLDDFVVTTNEVTNFYGESFLLTGSAGANGTITPANATVTLGGSQLFVITASNYYRIASLTTNGTPVVGMTFDNGSVATNFTWSNVQDNGALNALFTAQLATNAAATPYWWLAQFGLTNYNADAVADQDHDGLQAWQEFIVGTDPTNYASVLKVLSVTSDGVNDTVKWLSAPGSPNYNLFYSLNLTNALNGWAPSSNNIVQTAPTNTITIAQPGQPVYYKVSVTN